MVTKGMWGAVMLGVRWVAGGNFFFDVMPRQMHAKATARKQLKEQQQRQQTQGGGHQGGAQREAQDDEGDDGDGEGASEQETDAAPRSPQGRGAGRGGREPGVERRTGAGAAARLRQEEGFRERRTAGAREGSPPHLHQQQLQHPQRQGQPGWEQQQWDERVWQGDGNVSHLQRALTVGETETQSSSYPQLQPQAQSHSQSLFPLPQPISHLPPLALDEDGGACRTCGRCSPNHRRAPLGAPGAEEGEHFHPASSEPLGMEGMSAWGEDASGTSGERGSGHVEAGEGAGVAEGGLRRRSGKEEQDSQDGLEMERSIWRGSGGSVACMG